RAGSVARHGRAAAGVTIAMSDDSDETPPQSPAPKKPAADVKKPAGDPAGVPKLPRPDKDKTPDFRVIRSAPPPEAEGGNPLPLVIGLVVVVALAVGGYMYTQKNSGSGGGSGGGKTGTETTTTNGGGGVSAPTNILPNAANAPEGALERGMFLMEQGRYE